jgi:hypothetical protein
LWHISIASSQIDRLLFLLPQMPKGAPNKDDNKDFIHCEHIEKGRSFRQAKKLSPQTYISPLTGKTCRKAHQCFHYINRLFLDNKKNFDCIKKDLGLVTAEDSSIVRAKEEQALLHDHLSYYSSQRDLDDASLSTTTTTTTTTTAVDKSPVIKKQSVKKTQAAVVKEKTPISIRIPSAAVNNTIMALHSSSSSPGLPPNTSELML